MPKVKNRTRGDIAGERIGRCFPENVLERSEWKVLTAEKLAELCMEAHCRAYQPGETIFYEGDPCRGVYFISEGLIGVRKEDPDGNSVLLHLATDGDTLGYRPFLAGDSHRASAEVLKASDICFFDSEIMRSLLRENPDLGLEFLRRATRELGTAENRFYEAVRLNLRTRVAHLLLLFKDRYANVEADGRILLDLPISRQDMAAMIGVRAESLSRTIRTLTDEGLIDVSGHRAWILDVDRLIAEVAPPDLH
jgi:CRP/FNR family transcriptional regulator